MIVLELHFLSRNGISMVISKYSDRLREYSVISLVSLLVEV